MKLTQRSVLSLFVACAVLGPIGAAQAAPAATTVSYLNGFFGYVDGPIAIRATLGTESYSIAGTNLSDLENRYNALYSEAYVNGAGQNTGRAGALLDSAFPTLAGANGFPQGYESAGVVFPAIPALSTVPVFVSIAFDGLDFQTSFAANSNTLNVTVVGTTFNQSFTGVDRADAMTQLYNYVNTNISTLANQFHNAMASATIYDPVIGNPQSLLATLATQTALGGTSAGEAAGPGAHLDPIFTTSMEPQYFTANGMSNGDAIRIPLDYTWFADDDPRYAFSLDVPLSFVEQGTLTTYSGGLGFSYRMPLADNWYLTPQAHAAIVATTNSLPNGFEYGAALLSVAARSQYNMFFNDNTLKVSLIDTVGYYHSIGITIGNYSLNPKVDSYVFSNGLNFETDSSFTLFGDRSTWQAYFLDSRVLGTHSPIDAWDEVGFSIGTPDGITTQPWQNFRVGFSFAFAAAGYRAYELNFTERF